MVWVGINVSRIIDIIPERRVQVFVDASGAKCTMDELEAAANLAAKGGVPATALAHAGAIPGDVPVTSAVPGLGRGGVGPTASGAASIQRGIDPRPCAFKGGPGVLCQIRNIGAFSRIAIGYTRPDTLEAYLLHVDQMLNRPEQHVEVGYTCSFSYNLECFPR